MTTLSTPLATAPGNAEDPIVRNTRAVALLAKRSALQRSAFALVCDRVTYSVGTTASLILHALWFSCWVTANAVLPTPFDPFPFSLLTSIVSLEAIFLSLFVLNSQNRLTRDSDQRAQIDLQVNLLAEQEMTLVLRMLRDLCARADIAVPEGLTELLHEVDVEKVAATVARELPEQS
ncbi:putative membrane protein [Luteitalea pratensis]|uniref:Putative membrane protein n=1 Tax=Luteitalea pratensis TaxID=1855912 RepID=A0A143PRD6_LUTPR|nr:DUF1003 domain-containing protein [Luteitalea pratensis]AMY10680.1 putative membrane protein [Luteitalea pratensis]